MRWSRFVEEPSLSILNEHVAGQHTRTLRRRHGISLQMLYRWKQKCDGLAGNEVERLKTLEEWAQQCAVTLYFTDLGKPIENAHCESFHGRLRDECRNEHCD